MKSKNNLFYIHKHPEIINDSFEIKNGYHWGGNVNNLIEGLNRKPTTSARARGVESPVYDRLKG